MTEIRAMPVEAAGVRTSVLRGGPGRDPVLFLHGGVPALSPYCGGAHLWSGYLELAAREREILAPDLPGFGDTPAPEPYRIDALGRFALALIEALKLGRCHVVGHDEGGLIAIGMALDAPAAVRSVTVIASPTAAPSGDSVESPVLANPPRPPWSRATQAWALERLSYNRHHVDGALLDRCAAAAEAEPHRRAIAAADKQQNSLAASAAATKARLYAHCRERAFPVPAQIVWASHDPLAPVERGLALFRVAAERQPAAHFHVINRAGHFPFREEPEAFHHVLAAFHDGLAAAV